LWLVEQLSNKTKLSGFGTCHRRPDRSFFYKNRQFPLCARCTGIAVGFSSLLYFIIAQSFFDLWISIALILPTYLDGCIQLIWKVESNNTRRFITGLAAGIGLMSLASHIGLSIGRYLANAIY